VEVTTVRLSAEGPEGVVSGVAMGRKHLFGRRHGVEGGKSRGRWRSEASGPMTSLTVVIFALTTTAAIITRVNTVSLWFGGNPQSMLT